MNVD